MGNCFQKPLAMEKKKKKETSSSKLCQHLTLQSILLNYFNKNLKAHCTIQIPCCLGEPSKF